MAVTMRIKPDTSNVKIYRTSTINGFETWTKLDTDIDGDYAHFKATAGGVYVAKSHSNSVLIVALVVSILVMLCLILGAVLYFKKNPKKWMKLKNDAKNVKRNFDDNI